MRIGDKWLTGFDAVVMRGCCHPVPTHAPDATHEHMDCIVDDRDNGHCRGRGAPAAYAICGRTPCAVITELGECAMGTAVMHLADRRFIQVTSCAWVLIYGVLLIRALPAELQRGTSAIILAFGFVFSVFAAAIVTAIVVAIPLRITMNLFLQDRRCSHQSETIFLSLLLALIVAYVLEVQRERLGLYPPKGVATLSSFIDEMPPPRRLELIQSDGHEYIVWTGALSGPCDVPSGPSCYVFNPKGDLIDWQPETGDGGPVDELIHNSVQRRHVSMNEVLKITEAAAANRDDSKTGESRHSGSP